MCYHPFFFPWFWILPIVLIVILLFRRPWRRRWSGRPLFGAPLEKSPEDILAERFAKGELDEKEYNDRRTVLKST